MRVGKGNSRQPAGENKEWRNVLGGLAGGLGRKGGSRDGRGGEEKVGG